MDATRHSLSDDLDFHRFDISGWEFSTLGQTVVHRAITSPKNVAVKQTGICINYENLIRQAANVAQCLCKHGVSSGERVTLLSNRSIDGLVGALGIILTGAIYVPISPDYPLARIEHIVDDSGSRITVADHSYLHLMKSHRKCVMLADMTGKICEDLNFNEMLREISCFRPDSPAYILYTSGSSGRPKGVVVSHAALMNTLAWIVNAFRLRQGDCILQKTPWGFTDSLWEMFLPLLLGGTISFVDEDTVRNPVDLYHELNRSGSVITQFVPPALSAFLDDVCREIPSPSLPSLRWILNGGEEVPRALVDRWFSLFPNVGYANSYGMTESAIYATCYFMKKPPVWGMRRIPVGKPITNAAITILGGGNEVLGADEVGEICVGGKSLMTCYWGQPELTAKALIPHPKSGELIYRTGDYGSLRFDGEIAYLGRRDHQVKIRGMRVELGEVERVLAQHPCVKQAAVVTKGDRDAKSLVAFYTVHSEDPGEPALTAHLAGLLPSHMVPTRCIKLDTIPVTAHNKTDQARLLDVALPARVTKPSQKPTPGSVEDIIAQTWAEVLKTVDFGLDEGFFAAGGNSLLLIRVYANLPVHLQQILTIPDLLHYPTVRGLADRVREVEKGSPIAAERGAGTPPRRRDPAALRCLRQGVPASGSVDRHG